MLQLSGIKKDYGSFRALDISHASIPKGIHWIQGENGSGKTTLLKIIAGILPFEGNILLNQTISIKQHRKAYLSLVNYAEAEPVYPPYLTAYDLVALYCHTKKGKQDVVLQLLHDLHLSEALQKKLGTYSSGMMKKLSLALAFTGNPVLILLDEPLITIDRQALELIGTLINKKHMEEGVSFLLTSHQPFSGTPLQYTGTMQISNHSLQPVTT